MKHTYLKSTLTTALGIGALTVSSLAGAGVISLSWSGYFIALDPNGDVLANSSLSSKSNQYVTPISGTMQFDDVYGGGTVTVVPFNFFSNAPSAPATISGFEFQAIGDGMGGPGTLLLGNMLFDWKGGGMPVSLVMDAAGFFSGDMSPGGASSAVPASDGTYINSIYGYLNQGPMPIVTTAWNTSFAEGCTTGNCGFVNPSGVLPLVIDTAVNYAYDGPNTGGLPGTTSEGYYYGIGGNPMAYGAFQGTSFNFQFATLTTTGYDPNGQIINYDCSTGIHYSGMECGWVDPVPVPAAAWLFGSGLLGLIGVARRSRT